MATTIHFTSPTRKVLAKLRDGPKTVDELAAELKLTPNAVRNQIKKLVAANLAEASGRRRGVSKPSVLYSITPDGQIQFSTLYLPVMSHFLRVAESECPGKQLGSFMNKTGRGMAKRYPKPSGTMRQRVDAAAKLLSDFGAVPRVHRNNGSLVIKSSSCPLSALTSEHPAACRIIQGLLTEYMDCAAKICCDRGEEPRCCFEMKL